MTKQLFTNIVTRMAIIQKKCRDMIKVLEFVGIQVGEDPDGQGLSQLHGIRDLVSETVAALLLSTKDEDVTMEKIDMFLEDLGESEDSLKLINKKYVELFGNKKDSNTPSESVMAKNLQRKHPSPHERHRRHRGLTKADATPVTGYLWQGADHTYIIPYNIGVSYDDEEEYIKAYAVEVYQDSVAIDMLKDDRNGKELFEDDIVEVGDEQFRIDLTDAETLYKLMTAKRMDIRRVLAGYTLTLKDKQSLWEN